MSTLPKSAFQMLPLSRLHESPTNPRRVFDEAKLLELAAFVPGHKKLLLCPCPFCDLGRQKAHGCERSPFCGAHNGEGVQT